MKVLLVNKASGDNYSVEAGLADNKKHFDHHGKWSDYPAPSNNSAIPKLSSDDIVEITHIDADTLLGLFRMAGAQMPKLDYDLIEKVDLNGSSVVKDRMDPSYLFMVGVHLLARELGFPRAEKQPQDVTAKVEQMIHTPISKYIALGKEATEASEKSFKDKLVEKKGRVGLWAVGADDPFDPSRPYADGYDCVVVYRSNFKSISIYCAPNNPYEFGNREVAGIQFAGHAKACGSPRGEDFTLEDAKRVFDEVEKTVRNKTANKIMYKGQVYVRKPAKQLRYHGQLYVLAAEPKTKVDPGMIAWELSDTLEEIGKTAQNLAVHFDILTDLLATTATKVPQSAGTYAAGADEAIHYSDYILQTGNKAMKDFRDRMEKQLKSDFGNPPLDKKGNQREDWMAPAYKITRDESHRLAKYIKFKGARYKLATQQGRK